MILDSIFFYPVKSMSANAAAHIDVGSRGPQWDRRWMVIDADDRFVTGRALPQLVLCQVSTHDHGLTLSMHGDSIQVALPAASAATRDVVVWRDTVAAHDAGDADEQQRGRRHPADALGDAGAVGRRGGGVSHGKERAKP